MSNRLNAFLFSFLTVSFAQLSVASIPDSELVAYLKGEFSVTPAGSAAYRIPIKLPPNVAGVQPSLSFTYDSSGSNGLMGVGWNLGGLSSISRCATSHEIEGHLDGVDFDTNDQFCLDGQRLVKLANGTYRTQIDDFSHITGDTGGFTVIKPDGLTYTYGMSTNSRIRAEGRTDVLTWALEKVEDTYGNHYTVKYYNLGYLSGEYRPTQILMGNSSKTLSQVNFKYEIRDDILKGYTYGSLSQVWHRLQSVEVLSGNQLVSEYPITYKSYNDTSDLSVVSSIELCTSTYECTAPVVFTSTEKELGLADDLYWYNYSNYRSWWDHSARVRNVDVNGDGLTDVLIGPRKDNGRWHWLENTGEQFVDRGEAFSSSRYTSWWSHYSRVRNIDMTGDGLVDILIGPNKSTGEWYLLENTGGKFVDRGAIYTKNNYRTWGDHANRVRDVDVNGDGLSDILIGPRKDNGNWHWLENTGSQLIDRGVVINSSRYRSWWDHMSRVRNVDVTGDGLTDILIGPNKSTGEWYLIENTGGGFVDRGAIYTNNNYKSWGDHAGRVRDVDVNGDGLSDILIGPRKDNGNWHWLESTGTKLIDRGVIINSSRYRSWWEHMSRVRNIDMTGDGLTDILIGPNKSTGEWYLLENTRGGFVDQGAIFHESTFKSWGDHSNRVRNIDANGDGLLDILIGPRKDNGKWHVIPNKGKRVGIVTKITEGTLDKDINYLASIKKGQDNLVTTNQTSYPNRAVSGWLNVVTSVDQPNGIGGVNTSTYKYHGLRYNSPGRRSLGFSKIIIEDSNNNIRTTTDYSQTFPYVGMQTRSISEYIAPIYSPLSTSSFHLAKRYTDYGKGISFPYVSFSSVTKQFYENDLSYDGSPRKIGSKTTTTSNSYNNSGQVTNSTAIVTGDGNRYTTATRNYYQNGYAKRRKGELTRIEVTNSSLTSPQLTRTTEFQYDWVKERRTKEIIEPNNTDKNIRQVTSYTYDSRGNRTSSATCNGDYVNSCSISTSGARYSRTLYDPDGLHVHRTIDAEGKETVTQYDRRFGVMSSKTDINGLTTTSNYDSLGRLISTTSPLGITATTTREWCDYTCPTIGGNEAIYKVIKRAPGTPVSTSYYDSYKRVIRTESQGFASNEIIRIDTEYDEHGRVKRTTEPYFSSNNPEVYWNTPTYDFLNRKIKVTTPNQDGGYDDTSYISHHGYIKIIRDALGRETSEKKNALGKIVEIIDRQNNSMNYEYDSNSNLLVTTDSDGNEVRLSYDIRGRKTKLNDPDMGVWRYKYNTFDEVIEQTDAKNQKITTNYDVLGRMRSRSDIHGTATWTYFSPSAHIGSRGKLYEKKSSSGDYTRYTYNTTFGQLVTTTQKIGAKTFVVKNEYDSLGRERSTTYPATSKYPTGLKVYRAYTSRGFLNRVYKSDNSLTYWRAEALSPRGQLEAATFGNGVLDLNAHSYANGWLIGQQSYKGSADLRDMTYKFDEVGNIIERTDVLQNNMMEHFEYDSLDRLTRSYISGGPAGINHGTKSYTYDDLGNITYKSDAGSYSYSGCGGRPHAVCGVGVKRYVYDGNGSMTQVKVGTTVATTVGYTGYNKANYMQKGNYAITFNYDADLVRNYRSRVNGLSIDLQTYYVGTKGSGAKVFEQQVGTTTGTESIHYIYGSGSQAIATHITKGVSAKTQYLHRDHLGSVSLVTNDAGQVVNDPISFDAWGKRRNANWTDNPAGIGLASITGNIGFTGQESIEEIGLVHMNGRIYDPSIGRFLSADPLIQAPYNSQSYNRYSYVMNNPLGYVDPTGYGWLSKKWKKIGGFKGIFKAVVRAVVLGPGIAAIAYSKPVKNYIRSHKWAQQTISVVAGAADALGCSGICSLAASAYLADINGSTFEEFAKAAAVSMATGYMVGGAIGKGFLSSVIAGGATSKILGGKFADGALTAAVAFGVNSFAKSQFGETTFASRDGKMGISKEGTAAERQATFDKAMEAYPKAKNVQFNDVYKVAYKNSHGIERFALAANAEKLKSLVAQYQKSGVRFIAGETLPNGTVSIYRLAVVPFEGKMALPAPGGGVSWINVNFSGLQNAVVILGHELFHQAGGDLQLGRSPHVNANAHGYNTCVASKIC